MPTDLYFRAALEKKLMPKHLFEGNPVDEGTTRRDTDILMHRLEKPADSTHSSKCGLSPREQLEKIYVVPSSLQDEALALYSVSREVLCSVFKCETERGTLDATPKVSRHAGLTRGEHRGSRYHFI